MNFLSAGWLWLYAGAFLMLMEILTPGFVIFFFGLAAATLGLVLLVSPASWAPGATMQLALFSILSLVYLLTLRRWLMGTFFGDGKASDPLPDEYVGRLGNVTAEIRPDHPGRVLVGDAEWDATAKAVLLPGTEVKVAARTNLTLSVVAVS